MRRISPEGHPEAIDVPPMPGRRRLPVVPLGEPELERRTERRRLAGRSRQADAAHTEDDCGAHQGEPTEPTTHRVPPPRPPGVGVARTQYGERYASGRSHTAGLAWVCPL